MPVTIYYNNIEKAVCWF